jgi:hypothetical protein
MKDHSIARSAPLSLGWAQFPKCYIGQERRDRTLRRFDFFDLTDRGDDDEGARLRQSADDRRPEPTDTPVTSATLP